MRIGLLTNVYRDGFSGVANHVHLLKRSLEKHGQEVMVSAFEQPGLPEPEPGVVFSPGRNLTASYPVGFRLFCTSCRSIVLIWIFLHVHQPFLSGMVALASSEKRMSHWYLEPHTV